MRRSCSREASPSGYGTRLETGKPRKGLVGSSPTVSAIFVIPDLDLVGIRALYLLVEVLHEEVLRVQEDVVG